jgi:DNA-binding NtrC family response regulator
MKANLSMAELDDTFQTSDCIVYFVDDDRGMIHSSVQWLSLSGLKVRAFVDPKVLLRTIKPNSACIVVSDIKMPDLDGMSLMQHLHAKDKNLPVILITGHGDIPLAVEAMKKGAYEFLTKPFSPEKLLETIKSAQSSRMQMLSLLNATSETPIINDGAQPCSTDFNKNKDGGEVGPLNEMVGDYEKTIIMASMKKHGGDISLVLADLNLPRRTLNAKMKKYGITRRNFR